MKYGIHCGPTGKFLKKKTNSLLKVLDKLDGFSDNVKLKVLEVFEKTTSVENLTISNCTIYGNTPKEEKE